MPKLVKLTDVLRLSTTAHINRPGVTHCKGCTKAFERDDQMIICETPTSWFRGDDSVSGYHPECLIQRIHA